MDVDQDAIGDLVKRLRRAEGQAREATAMRSQVETARPSANSPRCPGCSAGARFAVIQEARLLFA